MATSAQSIPEGLLPLPPRFIAENHADDMLLSLDRWEWFLNKSAVVTDIIVEEECSVCLETLDPTDEHAKLQSENTPHNRKIIWPKACQCKCHVGCLREVLKKDPRCPTCRKILLRPPKGAFYLFHALCMGDFSFFPLSVEAPMPMKEDVLTGHIQLAAFACLTKQNQESLGMISTDCGRKTVEAMIRATYGPKMEEKMSIGDLRKFLVAQAMERMSPEETEGSWSGFANRLAYLTAYGYAVTKARENWAVQ